MVNSPNGRQSPAAPLLPLPTTADELRRFERCTAVGSDLELDPRLRKALDQVFVSDQPSLSFIATVFAWDSAVQTDRLYSAERLVEWVRLAGLGRLVPHVSALQLETLRELRDSVRSLVLARLRNARPRPADVELVNSYALLPPAAARLEASTFALRSDPLQVTALLSTLARDAIQVVAGPWSPRLRQCERTPCTHLFVDRSPTGRRRWCTSAGCGNRERAAQFRRRQLETSPAKVQDTP